MGVLPCQFIDGMSAQSLNLKGDETFSLSGYENGITPRQKLNLEITYKDGNKTSVEILLRIDTPIEVEYYKHGGILQYVLRELLN